MLHLLDNAPKLRGLYVITDAGLGGGHLAMARAALAGGARILQLRDKSRGQIASPAEILTLARQIRWLTWQNDALFIINDHLDLALECGADGVHLGQSDTPLLEARRALGAHKIIGISAKTPEAARLAEQSGATYLGVGAVFGTQTKSGAGNPLGLEDLRAVIDATSLPVAAIGGINAENIAAVLGAGAPMACVISALCVGTESAGTDPNSSKNEDLMAQNTRELVALFQSGQAR